MAILVENSKIDKEEIESLVIVDRDTRVLINKGKYGTIKDFKKKNIVIECSVMDELILENHLNRINFSGKTVKNKHRGKRILELEEEVANTFINYIAVRIDFVSIKDSKGRRVKIKKHDFNKLIRKIYKEIKRDIGDRRKDVPDCIASWCYAIEPDRHGNHLHLQLFLDANDYVDLSNKEKNELYEKEINAIVNYMYGVLERIGNTTSYCNINCVDLSNKKFKPLIVNKNDYWNRNCVRYWICYLCKFNKDIGSKSYGQSILQKPKMKNDSKNPLLTWYNSVDRLVKYSDWRAMDVRLDGISNHLNRIKTFFDIEEEISRYYDKYLLIPIRLIDVDSHDGLSTFLKRYQNYRYENSLIRDRNIAYFWTVNDIDLKIDFRFYSIYKVIDDEDVSDQIIYTIKKWLDGVGSLKSYKLDTDMLCETIVIDSTNYKDRNIARYLLTTMNVSNNEKQAMDVKNIRLFGNSKVNPPV